MVVLDREVDGGFHSHEGGGGTGGGDDGGGGGGSGGRRDPCGESALRVIGADAHWLDVVRTIGRRSTRGCGLQG